jgi:signal transduction histidine kinase
LAWITLCAGFTLFLWLRPLLFDDPAPRTSDIIALAAWLLVLGSVAEIIRVRRERGAVSARSKEQETLRLVSEERVRIARELHDVVAHHMSAIVIRAQAAERLGDKQPAVATEAAGWIARAGQEALSAMRHTVQVLRTGDGDRHVELAPQPTLDDIRTIAERLAPTGLAVEVRLPEPLPVLDPPIDLAAVRIAQEALTNALRHAEASRAVITVRDEDGGLLVVVDDDGRTGAAPPTDPVGHGLRGMTERAASCGGDLAIVPSPLGGWRVMAHLPHRRPRARPGDVVGVPA